MLQGKILLGEITFEEPQLEKISRVLRDEVAAAGVGRSVRNLAREWPALFALWLTNEAYFHFESRTYWPYVLDKLGVVGADQYSSRFGTAFLEVLNRFNLPTFRRMKTSWSYLGPILAHAGIPRSCLPEYFEKVLPRAAQVDLRDEDDFNELVEMLPSLYLTKTTERFLTFGERIARDFVSRTLELERLYRTSGKYPPPGDVGLPDRVVDAYRKWIESGGERGQVREARRLFRRPQIRVDPHQGVVLHLPSQSLASNEMRAEWCVESDAGYESEPEREDVSPDPGERASLEREFVLAEPYRHLKVRFVVGGAELGTWSFEGLSPERPVLFFSPDTDVVVSSRNLESREIGIVAPRDWVISGVREGIRIAARVIEDRGRMALGWGRMSARVVDLADSDEVVVEDPAPEGRSFTVKLGEASLPRPRLVVGDGREDSSPDVDRVFIGGAPAIEVYIGGPASAGHAPWRITVRSHLDRAESQASLVKGVSELETVSGDGLWTRIPLGQSALLGGYAWGEFDVEVVGPIGQDARFRFRVLPPVEIVCDAHDWSGEADFVQARLRVPEGVSVLDAEPTSDPREHVVSTARRARRVEIETIGFGGALVRLPLDVRLPRPSWSVYDPARKQALLAWSRKPLPLSLTEVEGSAPTLQLRLQTPWGLPANADLEIRGPGGCILAQVIDLNRTGYGTVDLAPLLAAARLKNSASLQAVLCLKLDRIVEIQCLQIRREWSPRDFECTEDESGALRFQWLEQIPVATRALRVESLLTPWEDSRWIDIPDDRRDGLPLPPDQFAKECGIYRVTLGRRDEWSGKFEPAADAECDVSIGDASNWTRSPLFSDTGPNGYLYRLLLEHYARVGGNLEPPDVREMSDDSTFASRLLRTRGALVQDGADDLLRKVDALLAKVHLGPILAAFAGEADERSPEALLRFGLLSRTWRDYEGAAASLTPRHKENLWRIWKPLGIWAELHTYKTDISGAGARTIRQLGAEVLHSLSPLQEGSRLRWWDGHDDHGVEAQVVRVENETGRSAFELVRLDAGVEVVCTTKGVEANALEFHLRRGLTGEWIPEATDDKRVEKLRSELSKREHWGVFYPVPPREICMPPDGPIPALVHSGSRDKIDEIRRQAEDIVPTAIGGSAYQSACFEWAVKAAADSEYRSDIIVLSNEVAVPVGSSFECDPPSFQDAASWRIFAEAKSRWIRNSLGEPLFAIPLLSWLVAVDVIWPSLGKNGWLRTSDEKRRDLSIDLYRLMPRLFEHDLLKVCAIEMLDRARWVYQP